MQTPSEETDGGSVSLRDCKDVVYTPMLTSDLDSEVDTDRKKPINTDYVQVVHLH